MGEGSKSNVEPPFVPLDEWTTTTTTIITTTTSTSLPCYCLPPPDSLPTIIVFDLDDCLWTPEMHELSGMPCIPVEGPLDPNDAQSALGIVGMKVPSQRSRRRRGGFDWGCQPQDEEIVELYPEARYVLRQLATNPLLKCVQLAVASTSLEPTYSKACINGIEIVEGVTLGSMLSYTQIGREGKLSTRKTSHFQLIREESGGVSYDEMLFFGKGCPPCS
jgi:hypothetical protein